VVKSSLLLLAVILLTSPLWAAPKKAPRQEIGYRMVKVRHGRFQAPHLTRYRDPAVVKSVNQQIDAIFAELGCGPEMEGKDELNIESSVKLAAKDIFSVHISGSYSCGAYPENDDDESATFDLRTGKPVSFEALFKDYERDKRAILSAIYPAEIEAAAKHPAPEGPVDEASCDESPWLYALDDLVDSHYSFNFSGEGLEIQPQWPHVIEACEKRVTVPYAKLRQFAAPGGLLERVQK
jgi:hypothetical protein